MKRSCRRRSCRRSTVQRERLPVTMLKSGSYPPDGLRMPPSSKTSRSGICSANSRRQWTGAASVTRTDDGNHRSDGYFGAINAAVHQPVSVDGSSRVAEAETSKSPANVQV